MRKPVIVEVSLSDPFEIFGCLVNGYNALRDAVEVSSTPAEFITRPNGSREVWSKPYISNQTPKRQIPGLHVLEIYQRYPCFDSSDYAYEDRFYRNFFFSKKPFTQEEINILAEMKRTGNLEYINDYNMPEQALPSVYYVGDGNKMLLVF